MRPDEPLSSRRSILIAVDHAVNDPKLPDLYQAPLWIDKLGKGKVKDMKYEPTDPNIIVENRGMKMAMPLLRIICFEPQAQLHDDYCMVQKILHLVSKSIESL